MTRRTICLAILVTLTAIGPVAHAGAAGPTSGQVSQYAGARWALGSPGGGSTTVEFTIGLDDVRGEDARIVTVLDGRLESVACEGGRRVTRRLAQKASPPGVAVDVRGGTASATIAVTLTGTTTTQADCADPDSATEATAELTANGTFSARWVASGDPLRYEDRGQGGRFWYQDAAATGTLSLDTASPGDLGTSTSAYLWEGIYTSGTADQGYYALGRDGGVFTFGRAPFLGSMGGLRLNAPTVGMSATLDSDGYWIAAADGGVFTFGAARFFGSLGSLRLNQPIVGIAATPSQRGYWLVAADGGVFAFGDAGFHGSTGNLRLNQPIVGMRPTPSGQGYWLVAADGGVFAFGDAGFHGSTGNLRLNQPIVGMEASPYGDGYWLVAADGGVFSFGGSSPFLGSTGNRVLNANVVAIVATMDGLGDWLVASDGGVFAFGTARFLGSLGGTPLNAPILAAAATR